MSGTEIRQELAKWQSFQTTKIGLLQSKMQEFYEILDRYIDNSGVRLESKESAQIYVDDCARVIGWLEACIAASRLIDDDTRDKGGSIILKKKWDKDLRDIQDNMKHAKRKGNH